MRLPASGKRAAAPLQSARAAVQCRRCQLLRCRDGRRIYGPDPPDVIGPIHECYAHEDLNLDDKPEWVRWGPQALETCTLGGRDCVIRSILVYKLDRLMCMKTRGSRGQCTLS